MTPSTDNNVTSLLDTAARRVPQRAALCTRSHSVTFSQLQQNVCQCANLLSRRGLHHGDRVIIMIPMSPALYTALLAVIRCGATAVFVDPWISMRRIAAFAAFADPSGFIGVPKSHLLRLLNPRLATLALTASTGPAPFGLPARFSLKAATKESADHAMAPVTPDESALITFTTGSSGTPKGANRTHRFLLAQHHALCNELDYRDNDVDMPMFPVFALRNLAAGITSVIPEIDFKKVSDANPQRLLQQIVQNKVTIVTASPPLLDALAALPEPPPLRRIITGGAPIRSTQLNAWQKAFPDTHIEIVYGSTEAEPVAHISAAQRLATNESLGICCGHPVDAVTARIIKITRTPVSADELDALTLPQGQTGELIVSADHVCRDYFRNPQAVLQNKIIQNDGHCGHRMGDTGFFDTSGRFILTGRVHTTILRGNDLLHAQLVEAHALALMQQALRVAALETNQQLTLVVQGPTIPDAAQTLDADHVIFTRRQLPLDPRHNAKIDYPKLRKLLNTGKL